MEGMKGFLQFEKGKNILNSRIAKINEKEFFTYIDFIAVEINSTDNTTKKLLFRQNRVNHILR